MGGLIQEQGKVPGFDFERQEEAQSRGGWGEKRKREELENGKTMRRVSNDPGGKEKGKGTQEEKPQKTAP